MVGSVSNFGLRATILTHLTAYFFFNFRRQNSWRESLVEASFDTFEHSHYRGYTYFYFSISNFDVYAHSRRGGSVKRV